jgi:hypothetical protein
MPVIRDIPLSLKIGDVLRREGFREHSKIRPEIEILIQELLTIVKKTHLLEPAIAYEIYTTTELSQRWLSLKCKPGIRNSALSSLLPQAKEVAVVVCTIGSRLEEQVTDYTSRGKLLRGTLLDGIGSAAVDLLTEEACGFIVEEVSSRGYKVSSPINPGMPGLPITKQKQLLKLAVAKEIGVSLTSAGIMIPRKSVSMVMGIGPQVAKLTRAEVCARCHLKKTCPYRIPT